MDTIMYLYGKQSRIKCFKYLNLKKKIKGKAKREHF